MLLHEEEMKMKKMKMKSVKMYFIPHIPIFLHAVTFLHVLYFYALRRRIEIETESKN